MTRPALGKLGVGDEVIVKVGGSHRIHNPVREIPARVVGAARIWVLIESLERRDTINGSSPIGAWRMRLDTQDEGGKYSSGPRFVTLAQHAYDKAETETRQFLSEQGIRVERWVGETDGPWYGREAELADLIRQHEAES